MEQNFDRFIKHILNVIKQPELHMREIPILVGLGILLVFIVLVVVAIIFVRPVEKPANRLEEKQLRARLRRNYIAILLFGSLAILFFGLTISYTSRAGFCAGCHEMNKAYLEAQKSVHRKVSCLTCHQQPGISGVFIEKLRLGEMLIAKTELFGGLTSTQVSNEACLRCHKGILSWTEQGKSIKMKHKEPLEAGYDCIDCHFTRPVLHVDKKKLDTFGMSRCVDCHNQKKASAECGVCHQPAAVPQKRASRSEYPMANVSDNVNCKKCHSAKNCLNCHTLQLPHPAAWINGGHAMDGFVGKKICWQCHGKQACRKCHPGAFPHADDWVKKHGPTSRGNGSTCSNCHAPSFCLQCHTDEKTGTLKPEPKAQENPGPGGLN